MLEEHSNRHTRTDKNGRSAKDVWIGNNTRRFHRGPPFSAGWQCSAEVGPQALVAGHCRQRFTALLPLLDAIWPELPHNWTHHDDGQPRMQRAEFQQVLDRTNRNDFWHVAA